ncbi:MAG: ATP-dependent Clp protease ATP-binding subunit [Lewinellaceae bacterium]|nr:ATP-dependent Clp protease ATP-binding subunit [Phaeodactylibacter sp.]MCB0613116.1 ATP-dependent Clp protease ATP-binding subunit [Phaeodactylibacter sp.]MCB9351739.1 ATP-dependent Clp protease ATP-binding subunit [Lewinellaceae bacterium]
MDKINYPLLYFEFQEEAVLGILVGTELEAIDSDLRSVRSALLDHLQKQYKKYDDYPLMDIMNPRLRMVEASIRPAYRNQSGSYPLSNTQKVSVPVVFGETEQGYYECYLPLFGESFYYYDPRQFDALVQHIVVTLLDRYTPEQIYRFQMLPRPSLEILPLKVNYDRDLYWSGIEYKREYKVLNRLAEQAPQKKNIRRNLSALPEAAWELEEKVTEAIDKLISTRSNVLAVGRPGTGKSAVLRQAIKKITAHSRKQQLDYTFWRILPQRITASSKYLGDWEELCELLVEELNTTNGILWVEDVVRLLQAGGEGPEDSVAAFLMSFLQQGKLQMMGEATPQELESMRRLLPGFAEAFQVVFIEELDEKKVIAVLEKFAAYAEKNLRMPITKEALQLSYRLLLRYYPYESFPGKGIKFLAQCVSEAQLRRAEKVNKKAVFDNFVRQTGLPELFLRDDLLLDIKELQDYFNERIIGQPAAVSKLCSLVKVYKAGLNNPYKPINTLLFAGPTGIGKTASAKALADYFFGKGQRKSPLVRIDMSEFQYPGQIVRLIGAGREPGQLVKDIRERPFSVLLLDEVEKADPSIFDALLGLLDEGVLVDAYGRETNFRNTIVIMTSNLGATGRKSIGFEQGGDDEAVYLSAIARHFRPEFVNRLDGVVVFGSLNQEDIRAITRKELKELKQREGFTKRQIDVHFSERVVDRIAAIGFDVRYGARPLQRAIEQSVVTPIANWMLKHQQAENCRLWIDYQDSLTIEQKSHP